MPDLSFPCRPTVTRGAVSLGLPARARPCSCGRQVVDRFEYRCVTCGHHPVEVIDRTWAARARQMGPRGDRVPSVRFRRVLDLQDRRAVAGLLSGAL